MTKEIGKYCHENNESPVSLGTCVSSEKFNPFLVHHQRQCPCIRINVSIPRRLPLTRPRIIFEIRVVEESRVMSS